MNLRERNQSFDSTLFCFIQELFEFHRLLIVHRNTVAPHGSDVLHTLLDALGAPPTVSDSTKSDQSYVDRDLHNTSTDSGEPINGDIGDAHDIDAETDPDGDDESRSSGIHVEFHDSLRQSRTPSVSFLLLYPHISRI